MLESDPKLLHRATFLSRLDRRLRPWFVRLPPTTAVRLYSRGRKRVLELYAKQPPKRPIDVPADFERTLWGLRFGSPVMNAAGMFKNGEGYRVVAGQGAGGYLAGTTTATPRTGNLKRGVAQPFAPYPRSGAASNWLGLPNPGHAVVAARLKRLERVDGCPIGASLAADPLPELSDDDRLDGLIEGLEIYARSGVDFLEINESCPNTEADAGTFRGFVERLGRISERFLTHRDRPLPVVVKLSNDTAPSRVPEIVDLLIELGYDGVNFGNTSVAYAELRQRIDRGERALYDHFTATFGGGVSGRPVKEASLTLCQRACDHVRSKTLDREFHIVRTGGVEASADVKASLDASVALVQWYTGYFEAFADDGHRVYERLYQRLAKRLTAAA